MTERQPPYGSPFTPEQLADIQDYLGIIQEKGGYGNIIIQVQNGVILTAGFDLI